MKLGVVCGVPVRLNPLTLPMLLIAKFNVPFYFGGTSLLILVGVAIDFRNQIESHMISSQYEGLMNKARKTGRM